MPAIAQLSPVGAGRSGQPGSGATQAGGADHAGV